MGIVGLERRARATTIYAGLVLSGLFVGATLGGVPARANHECTGVLPEVWLGPGPDNYVGSDHRSDNVNGQAGGDKIVGNSCRDFLKGNEGVDQLRGDGGPDYVYGLQGDDSEYKWNDSHSWQGGIHGGDGDDWLEGNDNTDTVYDLSCCDQDLVMGGQGEGDFLRIDDGDGQDSADCGSEGYDALYRDGYDTGSSGTGCEQVTVR